MKRFNYKAKEKKSGKLIKGTIQAEDEQAAEYEEGGECDQSIFHDLLGTFGVAFDKVFRKNITHGEASKTKYMLYFSIRGWGSHQSFLIRIEMGEKFGIGCLLRTCTNIHRETLALSCETEKIEKNVKIAP